MFAHHWHTEEQMNNPQTYRKDNIVVTSSDAFICKILKVFGQCIQSFIRQFIIYSLRNLSVREAQMVLLTTGKKINPNDEVLSQLVYESHMSTGIQMYVLLFLVKRSPYV